MKLDPKPPDQTVENAGKTRTIGDQVIRWGAVAGALTAIIGVVALVVPDPDPTLDARLDALDIQSGVTFADFEGRQILAATGWDPNLALASQPAPIDPRRAVVTAGQSPRDLVVQQFAVPRAKAKVKLPKGCRLSESKGDIACATGQALSWAASAQKKSDTQVPKPTDDEVLASAREFLRVLRDTRQREVTRDGERVIEPLGVTVSLEAVVEGYQGEELEVRWSLYRKGSDKPIGRDWLVNRRVLSFEPIANTQRIAQEFWVPLPRDKATSYIRVTLYGPDSVPITRRDTKRFR